MTPKDVLQVLTPPFLWSIGKNLKRRMMRSVDHYSYTSEGWITGLPSAVPAEHYWATLTRKGRAASEQLIARAVACAPALTIGRDDLSHVIFAYALALAGHNRREIVVLDYGGGLGDYYWVGKSFVPWLDLDYHCKELAAVAESGRVLCPEVKWHTSDCCFEQTYDLVMFSSSLQYTRDWRDILSRAARSAAQYLLLMDTPMVRNVPTYVGTERSAGLTNLHYQLNRDEVVGTVEHAGLRLMREFEMGGHPFVAKAPEQPTKLGLLFCQPSIPMSSSYSRGIHTQNV